jgi:hypothetical protein
LRCSKWSEGGPARWQHETETPEARHYTLIPRRRATSACRCTRAATASSTRTTRSCATNVRIALAWATSWKPDVDGRLVLGKCKKASDLDRELAPFDFVILLNRDFWLNPRVTDGQRDALLDHELMHAAIAYDEHGDPKSRRARPHGLPDPQARPRGVRDIVARHGCYKADLEDFARAIARAERDAGAWVSYTTLHEQLKADRRRRAGARDRDVER